MNKPTNILLLIGLALAQTPGIVWVANAAESDVADQPGTSTQDVMEQARSRFPAAVATLEADCPATGINRRGKHDWVAILTK